MPDPIDVQALIDSRDLSPVQRQLLALCFLVVMIDGFDTAVIGFIAPALRAEWELPVSRLAPLFASGLFGLMAGAFAVGPLADRHGRKKMLVAPMAAFGAATLLSALSGNLETLIALRFLTGIGLGGAMPTAITLSSEYCPAARRSSLVTSMFCGFTIGSALGGLIASRVLEPLGWRVLLVGGGVAPLVLAPVLWRSIPESVRYLVLTGAARERIAAVAARIAPDADLTGATFVGERPPGISPVRQLLSGGLMAGTLLLWLAFFMSLMVVYLLSSWMPALMQQARGASLSHAALITAMLQVGGTVGAVAVGRMMDALDPHWVLGAVYGAGALCIVSIGIAESPWAMGLAVFGAGFCVSGGQVGGNALSASFYPAAYRATGVSWANGVGRSGSIAGSLLGGGMLALAWDLKKVYALVAVPTMVAAVALVGLGYAVRRGGRISSSEKGVRFV